MTEDQQPAGGGPLAPGSESAAELAALLAEGKEARLTAFAQYSPNVPEIVKATIRPKPEMDLNGIAEMAGARVVDIVVTETPMTWRVVDGVEVMRPADFGDPVAVIEVCAVGRAVLKQTEGVTP